LEKSFSDYFLNIAVKHLLSNELFGEVTNEQIKRMTTELKKYSKKVTFDQVANSVVLEKMILADMVLGCNKSTLETIISQTQAVEHFNVTELGNVRDFVHNGVIKFLISNSNGGDGLYLLATPIALSMGAGTIPTFTYTDKQGYTGLSGDDYQGSVSFTPTKTMKLYTTRFYDDTKVLVFSGKTLNDLKVKRITLDINIL
jgi:hypothetical protein